MSLALAFHSYEVNPSLRSLYIRTYVIFTSLSAGRFNHVWWLQVSHDLTVYLAAVSKLVVDFFFEILRKDCEK